MSDSENGPYVALEEDPQDLPFKELLNKQYVLRPPLSERRNKPTPSRANDIVYVFTNSIMMLIFFASQKFADWLDEMGEEASEM